MSSLDDPPAEARPPPRGGPRRWVLGGVASVVGLLALLGLLVGVLLHSLDHPWIKRRIQALVRTSGGVDIDYRALRVDLARGLEIDELSVQSPEEVRAVARELVRVGRIAVGWQLGGLLRHRHAVDRVTVSDVAVTVVVDEHGRTSLDAIPSEPTGSPPPEVPLSRKPTELFGMDPHVGQIEVDRVAVALIQTKQGTVFDRMDLRGLAARIAFSPVAAGVGFTAKVALGSESAPLELVVERGSREKLASAHGKVWLSVSGNSRAATAAFDLRMDGQSFAPTVLADHWLHSEMAVRFDPAACQTLVTVDKLEAGDGALSAHALLEVPDIGDPVLRHADGQADAARLLHWLPPGLVPVTADKAGIQFEVASLVLATPPHLSVETAQGAGLVSGRVTAEVDLANVALELAGGPLQAATTKISLRATPTTSQDGMAAHASVATTGLTVAAGAARVAMDDLRLVMDATREASGVLDGHADLRFTKLELDGGAHGLGRDGQIEVRLQGVRPSKDGPLATRGDVTASLSMASLGARASAGSVAADHLTVHAHSRLLGQEPYALDLEVGAARVHVADSAGAPRIDASLRMSGAVHDLFPNLERPLASRAVMHMMCDVGDTSVTLGVTKRTNGLDFAVRAGLPSLKVARPFLPPDLAKQAPWDQIGLTLSSTGHVEGLSSSSPRIDEKTNLEIARPAYGDVSAQAVSLLLETKGTASHHDINADVRATALALGDGVTSDDHVSMKASVDLEHRSVLWDLATDGRATTKISGNVSFDPARKAVVFAVDANLKGLSKLAPLLAKAHAAEGLDVSQLAAAFKVEGAVLGVVANVGHRGEFTLQPEPTKTAGVVGKAEVTVEHFHWVKGDNEYTTKSASWHADLGFADGRRTVESHLEVGAVHLDLGPKDVDLTAVRDDSSFAVTGDIKDPTIHIVQHSTIGQVEQDLAPAYPVGDVTFLVSAERDPEGMIHISDLKFVNAVGGTTLGLSGNFEMRGERRVLSVTTSFGQDLSRLTRTPELFSGRGNLSFVANVTSPDLSLFRVRTSLRGENVFLKLPRAHVELEGASGEVPIAATFEVGKHGFELRPDDKRTAYSMLRFADQHPLLEKSGFLSVASLKTPLVTLSPLVGNFAIEQNIVSLRQFEMGVRHGTITGLASLAWDGPKSSVELHVRASGVQSSHGEPFDGNIAVVISAGDRTIDGRAEVLRIGKRHLLDLLDMADPTHVDPATNGIRSALRFGYPDKLRLVFDHGFVSAHLEMGGLASLFSISDISGRPIGPIVDKLLEPTPDTDGDP